MKTAIIAFSGGLDTSFLVPYCREAYGIDRIITCTVNTGGFDAIEADKIAARSKEVGADKHVFVDGSQIYYDAIIKYLIFGNCTYDGYPLCVSAERPVIAALALDVCNEEMADYFINGSTGAGNDQYRFDVATQVLGQGRISGLSPIREFGITREFSTDYLRKRGVSVTEKKTKYSYNVGLWGISIGGGETHKSDGLIPDDAWYSQSDPSAKKGVLEIAFEKGEPVSVVFEGEKTTGGVEAIRRITEVGNRFAIGRNYYLSTTTPGKKGRIAFESPAADLLYEAHHRLEAITMTQSQITGKRLIAERFGAMLQEAKMYDPYMDDMKALLVSSQRRVSGVAKVYIEPGIIKATTVTSPYDLLSVKGAVYGETSTAYSGADAKGSALIHGFEQRLYHSLERGDIKRTRIFLGAQPS